MGCETWGREQISPTDVRISSMAKLPEGISWVTELRRAIWREGGRVLGRPRQGDGMRTEAMRGGGDVTRQMPGSTARVTTQGTGLTND